MSRPSILIVDDDKAFSGKLTQALTGLFSVEQCSSEKTYRNLYLPGKFDLLIMDIRLDKGREGLELLREALRADPLQAAIVITAYSDMETFTDALEAGTLAYLDKKELLESFPKMLIGRTVEEIIERGRMRRKSIELESRLQSAIRLLDQQRSAGIHPAQITDYKRHLARSELALVESAIDAFDETRHTELAEKLGYNDRYVFRRRLLKHLDSYPEARSEFAKVAGILEKRKYGGTR